MSPWLPSLKGVTTPILQVGQPNVSGSIATITCTFLDGSSHNCMVCCSTDPSVGLAGSGYLSSTNGPRVSVTLECLTSGQMYYCKAAATNTNSKNCAGPVVGGAKVFFSFMATAVPTSSSSTTATPQPSNCKYRFHNVCVCITTPTLPAIYNTWLCVYSLFGMHLWFKLSSKI